MRFPIGPYLAFVAFGLFWGTWGSALPVLREQSGLSDSELGGALMWIGIGALPAMLFTGRVIDRFGVRTTGMFLAALGAASVLLALYSRDLVTLSAGMMLVGAASGAADVAANSLAGLVESRSKRRVITLGHAVFSASVVVGSLATGALLAGGVDVVSVFAGVAVVSIVVGGAIRMKAEGRQAAPAGGNVESRRVRDVRRVWPFVLVGLVGALGFAAENAHQSWSAIFLLDELAANAWIAALAPATFAGVSAITRFAVGTLVSISDSWLLIGGAIVASAGTILLASAENLQVALIGLALAAMGTSVLFPTLLSRSVRNVEAAYRGRATSTVGTFAYLGFVFGPAYVGALAGPFGLRGALLGVAGLIIVFALVVRFVTRPTLTPALTESSSNVAHERRVSL